jgi:hypothetical protein
MSVHVVQANIPRPTNDVAGVNALVYRVHYCPRVLKVGIKCKTSCMFAKCDMCFTSQGNEDANITTTKRSSKRRSMPADAKAITLRKDKLESKELRKWKNKCIHNDDHKLIPRDDPSNFRKGLRTKKEAGRYFWPEECASCKKNFPDV